MAYRTRISKTKQQAEALEVNGVTIAVHSDSAVEVLIEAGGATIRRVPRPANMKRCLTRLVRAGDQGSTPNAGAFGGDQD